MDDPDLPADLPEVYAEYLRLARVGMASAEIARRLGVDASALPLLERLAAAKLIARGRPGRSDHSLTDDDGGS